MSDLYSNRSMAKMRRERDRKIIPPERDPRFGDATAEVYALLDEIASGDDKPITPMSSEVE